MAKKKETNTEKKQLHVEAVRQMVALATSGFGLIVALAVVVTLQLSKLLDRLQN